MLINDNPFECGFENSVHLDTNIEFLGKESLKKIKTKGINKKLMGVKIDTKELGLTDVQLLDTNNNIIGELRSAAFSPTFKKRCSGMGCFGSKRNWNIRQRFS